MRNPPCNAASIRGRASRHNPAPGERQAAADIAADAAGTGDDDRLVRVPPSRRLRIGPKLYDMKTIMSAPSQAIGLALMSGRDRPFAFDYRFCHDAVDPIPRKPRPSSAARPSRPPKAALLSALEAMLSPLGFTVERMVATEPGMPDIENLYARLGT